MNISHRTADATVFAVAVLLRAGWILWRQYQQGDAIEFDDESIHWQIARNLVEHGALVTDDGRYASRMPLYPLTLAPFTLLGEFALLAARLHQAALGGVTAVLCARLTRRAAGWRAGLFAGLAVAVDPFAVFFSQLLLTETLFTLLGVGLVSASYDALCGASDRAPSSSVRHADASRARVHPALAALGTAAIFTRPSSAGWVLLVWVAACAVDPRRAVGRAAVCAGALAACMLPWGLRNAAVIGVPAWLSANGGVTLYDAQGPQARGDSDQSFLRQMPELDALGEVARDQRLRELAIEQMRRDPARVLALAWTKFERTWSLTPNVAPYRAGPAAIASAIFTAAVLIGAGIGAARCWLNPDRPRATLHGLVWTAVVYFTLLHCVYVGSVRYRVPLMPLLAIAAATAVAPPRMTREPNAPDAPPPVARGD